ncbi:3-hydroxybutyrate dehydrogenase [Nioella nitratireducens]|uniref:3-hydroxybutyrate dehydrogenase n=1 Tax=Nioella nitratireducens TaxID=1287720 RepID=UPI0008FCFE17|nr:3-hydroxybutyrate dehydrogenase [Nioella nitratireducens]
MTDLSGKTALVTGSVQGIGLAIAEALAGAGARIAVHGIAGDAQIHEVCEHLHKLGSPQAEFFPGDLRQPDRIDELMEAVAAWGGADILVNNAGIQHTAPIRDMPRAQWDAILAINLSAAFHTMQHALPVMAERGFGRVVNIASVQGLIGSVEKAPYVAAKHGLVGLSKVAALEYARAGSRESGGVTVNCICPGWTETTLLGPQIDAAVAAHGGYREEGIAAMVTGKQPSGRMSDPSEMGRLALWLCDPASHNVTGTAIPVDGGWTAQ